MADVDFSNAVLDVNYSNPLAMERFFDFDYTSYLYDINSNRINQNETISRITDTATKASFLYTGTFTASGTEFYMGQYFGGGIGGTWKVSNISFASGDTYSFVVDIELEGNA